jgi:hypothetical protein
MPSHVREWVTDLQAEDVSPGDHPEGSQPGAQRSGHVVGADAAVEHRVHSSGGDMVSGRLRSGLRG